MHLCLNVVHELPPSAGVPPLDLQNHSACNAASFARSGPQIDQGSFHAGAQAGPFPQGRLSAVPPAFPGSKVSTSAKKH